MALVTLGPLISEARGSIGLTVFSRNPSGAYIRNRTTPFNPNSPRQQEVRGQFGFVQFEWRLNTTAAQRRAWVNYAQATVLRNPLGAQHHATGLQMFMRTNALSARAGVGVYYDAPIEPGGAGLPLVTFDFNPIDGFRVAAITPSIGTNAFIQLLFSGIVNQTRNFFAGPYQQTIFLIGPVPLPVTLIPPAGVPPGMRIFIDLRHVDNTGRVGNNFRSHEDS